MWQFQGTPSPLAQYITPPAPLWDTLGLTESARTDQRRSETSWRGPDIVTGADPGISQPRRASAKTKLPPGAASETALPLDSAYKVASVPSPGRGPSTPPESSPTQSAGFLSAPDFHSKPSGSQHNPNEAVARTTKGFTPQRSRDQSILEKAERSMDGHALPSHRTITASTGQGSGISGSFQQRRSSFFTVGRVFLALWPEPSASETDDMLGASVVKGRFGESIQSTIRRFVVVKEGSSYCVSMPISTYGGLGAGRKNIKKSDHAIIYSGNCPPEPRPSEWPSRGEPGLCPISIRVDVDSTEEALDPMSRLDYGRTYTVEHHNKVKNIGMIDEASTRHFLHQFSIVWESARSTTWLNGSLSNHSSYCSNGMPLMLDLVWCTHAAEAGHRAASNSDSSRFDASGEADQQQQGTDSSHIPQQEPRHLTDDHAFLALGSAVLQVNGLPAQTAAQLLEIRDEAARESLVHSIELERAYKPSCSASDVEMAMTVLLHRGYSRQQSSRILTHAL